MRVVFLLAATALVVTGCASGPLGDYGYTNANNNIALNGIGIQAGLGGGGGVVTGGVVQMPGQGSEGMPQSTNSMPPGAWYMF